MHFLALHLPHKLQDSLDHITKDVKQRIEKHLPAASSRIQFHSRANRHISLVRFGHHLSPSELHVYRPAIKDAVKRVKWGHEHHAFDLSGKVRGSRKLHVDDEGWIIIRVDPSATLTQFATEVIKAVHQKRPKVKLSTDAPNHRHISIARVDKNKVSLAKLRKVLAGNSYQVPCDRFEVHNIHLKVSQGHLHYKEVPPAFAVGPK
jgi:hypothetical protein